MKNIFELKFFKKNRIALELLTTVIVVGVLFWNGEEIIKGFHHLDGLSKVVLVAFGFKAIFESVEVFFSALLKEDTPMIHIIDGIISFLLVKLIIVVVLKDIFSIEILSLLISLTFIWRILLIKFSDELL